MESDINFSLIPLTWCCLGMILLAILGSIRNIFYLREKGKLNEAGRTTEYLPNLISTLGVYIYAKHHKYYNS